MKVLEEYVYSTYLFLTAEVLIIKEKFDMSTVTAGVC